MADLRGTKTRRRGKEPALFQRIGQRPGGRRDGSPHSGGRSRLESTPFLGERGNPLLARSARSSYFDLKKSGRGGA